MQAFRIEILNPKAIRLLKDLQDLDLIIMTEESETSLKSYLAEMRKDADSAPSEDEIMNMVKEVRQERYGKK